MPEDYFKRFEKIMKVCRTMAAICGGDILSPNFRVTVHTWLVINAINVFLVLSAYTMYHSLVVQGDWQLMLQSLSVVGSGLQGYSKLVSGIVLRKTVLSVYGKLDQIYTDYQDDPDYKPALARQVALTANILKAAISLIITTVAVIIAYPLIYGFIYAEKLTIVHFLIPGLSPETDRGYTIYAFYHSFCVILGGFGNCAGDMLTFIAITHVPLVKDVFKVKCQKLCRELSSKSKNHKNITELLLEIIKWHQHYNIYVGEIELVYYYVIFVQVSTSVAGICCTLFSIVTRSWPAAIIYFLYCMLTMYAYCALGNLVDVSNDEIEAAVYGDILWYKLPAAEQKQVLLMLRKSQKSLSLTIASVMPLSMTTALHLTKCIYSYMMMLVRFMSDDI